MAQSRTRWIGWLGLAFLVVSIIQLFVIQIVKGEELAEQGRIVRTSASAVQAPRGKIVDASGQVLVDSVATHHIAVNQKHILEYRHKDEDGETIGVGPQEAARQLAPLLGVDEAELGGAMIGDNSYEYIAKNVDEETFRQIRKMGIYGVEWEPSFQRVYPGGATAGRIVGSVDQDGKGNSGLELTFDDELTGIPGEEAHEIGPTGAIIPGAKTTVKEAKPGATVHTTINADLQYAAERAVDRTVKKFSAEWGSVVVIDIETSQVLVMADSGTVEPGTELQSALATQMVFEPGSVGKVLTFATALESGSIEPQSEFSMNHTYVTENGQTFVDVNRHQGVSLTATGVLARSMNTGTVMIGELTTDEERYNTLKKFGLGAETGIELPGESSGLLTEPETWDGRTKYTTMFGQGYAVTALQAANIAATIGREGTWMAPRLTSGVTTADGQFTATPVPTPKEAMHPAAAQQLLLMMESVTSEEAEGTGSLAKIDGYRLAAKTGTAEIASGGKIASMVGVLPADEPELALAVVVYKPKTGLTAGEIAAPLMASVELDAIRVLGIQPSKGKPKLYPSEPGQQ